MSRTQEIHPRRFNEVCAALAAAPPNTVKSGEASCQAQPQPPPAVASGPQQRDFSCGAQQVVASVGAQQALCEAEALVRTVAGVDATGPAAVRLAGTPVVVSDRNASRESADMCDSLSRTLQASTMRDSPAASFPIDRDGKARKRTQPERREDPSRRHERAVRDDYSFSRTASVVPGHHGDRSRTTLRCPPRDRSRVSKVAIPLGPMPESTTKRRQEGHLLGRGHVPCDRRRGGPQTPRVPMLPNAVNISD